MTDIEAAVGGTMDLQTAIHEVMKTSIVHDGMVKGLRECAKALDRREALLCILAENCNEASYRKLVEALCSQHSIPLIKVEDNKKLGEWAGMCKLDKDGKPRKVVGASCVVIKDYGKETPALDVVKGYMKTAAA